MTVSGDVLTRKGEVLGSAIDVVTWERAVSVIDGWAATRDSRVVCICNAHSLVTARTDHEFRSAINSADLATADGAPVAFMLRRQGNAGQQRINGPDLMWRYCDHAAKEGRSIYLYGSSDETLQLLQRNLASNFPGLKIVGSYSPPLPHFERSGRRGDRSFHK